MRTIAVIIIVIIFNGIVVNQLNGQNEKKTENRTQQEGQRSTKSNYEILQYKIKFTESTDTGTERGRLMKRRVDKFREWPAMALMDFGAKEVLWKAGNVLVIKIDKIDESEEGQPTTREVIEKILREYSNIGSIEFLAVASKENYPINSAIDIDEKAKELVNYLREKEKEDGYWPLSVDLESLAFNSTVNSRIVHCKWLTRSEVTLRAKGVPVEKGVLAGSDGVFSFEKGFLTGNGGVFSFEQKYTFDILRTDELNTDVQIALSIFRLVQVYENQDWKFTESDLSSVSRETDQNGLQVVKYEFCTERKDDFRKFTRKHVNYQIAIVMDGYILGEISVMKELPGRGIIGGTKHAGLTIEEQDDLIRSFRCAMWSSPPFEFDLIDS